MSAELDNDSVLPAALLMFSSWWLLYKSLVQFDCKELEGKGFLDIFISLALVVDVLRYVVVCCDWFGNDCFWFNATNENAVLSVR